MLFDKNLFTFNAASADSNFLERIVRHEAGVAANDAAGAAIKPDAMVTRFTKDLWKLAQGGLTQSDGNSSNAALAEVSKTLIAFAMQKYYTETPSSKGYAKELFTSLTGGVSFDRSDVAATWAEAKGKQYFDAYLQQNDPGLTQAERNVMAAQLADITQWFVQAGSEGMQASAGPQRSFMLGGKTDDVLSGGDAADLFLGNAGSDTLKGGSGEDVYIFGASHGADVIDDNQGKTGVFTGGRPYKEERPVGAGQNDLILKFDGGDQITIKNYFSNAQTLTRSASYVGEGYELNYGGILEAFASVVQRLVWQGDGDGNTMAGLSDYANRIESGGGADVLTGGDLDDTLNGGAGEDTYYADAGDFVIDADGQGAVYFGGRVLTGGKWDADAEWFQSDDGEFQYLEVGSMIFALHNGSVLKIQGINVSAQTLDNGDVLSGQPGLGIVLKTEGEDDDSGDDESNDDSNDDSPARFGDAENTTSPLILDLNGDGVKTLNKTAGKHFDHAGDGFAERTGWVDKDDGLLVRDLNGDGKITSGRELFGNHTLLKNGINAGKRAANGFEALKDLDSNADGLVDDKDTAFASLRVWKDTNGNGLTDTGELLSLAQAGVKSLKVAYTDAGSSAEADAQGNQHQQLGAFTQTDGSTQNMHDVWFATSSWDTIDQRSPLALSAAIAALPEMEGRGTLGSLHQAMGRDAKNESHYLRRYS
jgi:hypothetical protein